MLHAIYSLIVDRDPRFAYQAWHLCHSLVERCEAKRSDIHVHCTTDVDPNTRRLFDRAGFRTHSLERFGDGRHCNKVVQYKSLLAETFDVVVLLDTDTIAVDDLRSWLLRNSILGKTVDGAATSIGVLREVAQAASLRPPSQTAAPDNGLGETFRNYCNGGMYAIPKAHLRLIGDAWRKWAEWLLANPEPLRKAGREINVDQISFWLALLDTGAPFEPVASNMNYFIHMDAQHIYHDATRDIALLHYHNSSLNVVGMLAPQASLESSAVDAVARANAQIGKHFQNALFWSYRYAHFPERGSGMGSRGENLLYKQQLLREQGVERVETVLDIGCGDLEVIGGLALNQYTGVDVSPTAIAHARQRLPAAQFYLGLQDEIAAADMVLCFEVLIHQPTHQEYLSTLEFAASRARRTLLVSGYQSNTAAIEHNPMVHFHEPLEASLRKNGRFSSVRQIGEHTDVTIFRCDV